MPLLKSVSLMRGSLNSFSSTLNSFRDASYERFINSIQTVDASSREAFDVSLIVSLLAALVVVVSGLIISSLVTKNILNVVDSLEEMARGEGDLTKRLIASGNDEIGRLVDAFNTFVAKLQGIVQSISCSAGQLTSADRFY
ncbi:MAG: methyl-accepting chemotaxis protein [Gammaproteobacteria bacterium]|nr:methyl-accepting chemotaxis protein [Gammaproteobacteria bacterium]